jgi:hypothetical protein
VPHSSELSRFGHLKESIHVDEEFSANVPEQLRKALDVVPFVRRTGSDWCPWCLIESGNMYPVSHCYSFPLSVDIFQLTLAEYRKASFFIKKDAT